jgi:hypothetical protein
MNKVGLLILIGILGVSNQPLNAQNTTSGYSFDDYRQECLQRAVGQGLARELAIDLCNCTLQKIRSQYTIGQFRTLVQKSKTDKSIARRLSSIGESCLDTILYEE